MYTNSTTGPYFFLFLPLCIGSKLWQLGQSIRKLLILLSRLSPFIWSSSKGSRPSLLFLFHPHFSHFGFFKPAEKGVFLIYIIVILADFLGDTLLYLLGRQGNSFIVKHGAKIGLTAQKLRQADDYYKNNSKKTVVMSKIFHGIGIIGLISAGILHINFKHYIRLCILVSFVQTAALLIVGFLFGHAYLRIAEYLDYFAAFISALALLAIAFIIYYKSKKSS